ncbi:CDP-diacylglycerol--glycerol-3-phosphate 3-phosphatidyltransferase [Moraxella bovoculi]|uniref:CDP-diacylglycerol--glycerol-3-phosphate 3-phosphatidyltransferase n=1 Tax=Moraxella bovoculi 237 TaxID=743974 RepID=A0A066UL93_9GAMM|nr:CDP-diacylglycerol--glycerol-3-phosphate 3-phosphatidyltransferase [Moraxella bovoculi]AKG17661.1 CDP-diacylglycerol--glycerol-3-phosphate 3-phosphatidyltransferase [Moraxella bovoculi]AKG19463.1 CDP-diacylglycerol--glycerol-3-phosphate 3-phosphatidyltransferase [Moraxella bovoculi]ALT07575.1 CDP-diacylglycerol--glycerol-3-phosphate 3-phosphatidyltransferase [Moraxella bovoculi]KDN24949.1 CDP-diacylglycerol--glycerol-3-phosphate 3-phosphatidyltransferase [Moraxella bovoculi 237]NSM10522.1 C
MTQSSHAKDTIFNLPNNLTIARIVMIPLFIAIAYWPPALGIGVPAIPNNAIARLGMLEYSDSMLRHFLLTFLFILAAITDWLDGYLARKMNITSAFGRFLDPVADKLMVAAALIILVQWHPNIVMATCGIVIISREIAVSALREWMAELGARTSVAVSYVGKLKTTFQMIAISVLLLNWQSLEILGYILMIIAVLLTLWSMMIYLKAAWPYLKKP